MPLDAKEVRRRRSSSLVYTEPPESLEQLSDQAALPNLNAEWVNAKGQHAHARLVRPWVLWGTSSRARADP